MDQNQLRAWENRCIQEEPPACQAACPLHVDVRAFMERMAAADADGARKVLERTLPLPGVLGRICDRPCESRCLRAKAGDPLAVGALERACMQHARPGPKPLVLPAKGKRAAVLGGGLAALVCAWDLLRKGFAVTLFAPGAPGGPLTALPEAVLPAASLKAELERLAGMGLKVVADSPRTLADLEPGFDAVFLEHPHPDCPASRQELDPVTLQAAPGVFCGGWPGPDRRESFMAQAADGRRAASSMDRHMSGASLTLSREKEGPYPTRLYTSLAGVEPLARAVDAGPDSAFPMKEAAREAARCLLCECMECVKVCAYMQRYKGYPKKLVRQIYNNAAIVQGVHQANRMINSCALCGLCEAVCPEDFSMARVCLEARADMVERGKMPPAAHEFALEDLAFNTGPGFALSRAEPGVTTCATVFFPGCQLSASRPGHVRAVYGHLRARLTGGVGLMLGCCGVPAHWAARQDLADAVRERLLADLAALGSPRVVLACASCLEHFRRFLPEVPVVSLWEALEEAGLPPSGGKRPAGRLALHDPCSLRGEAPVRQAVRRILDSLGVAWEELPLNNQYAQCCGYGGLLSNVDPDLSREFAARIASTDAPELAASCAMCRDRLARQGKPAWHVLDFLFDAPAPTDAGPGFSDRQEARARLRATLLRDIWGEDAPQPASAGISYAPGVPDVMEQRHILRQDVEQALAGGKTLFEDRASGRKLAFSRPRNVSYWVEYTDAGGTPLVTRAWSHRMKVGDVQGALTASSAYTALPQDGEWTCACGAATQPAAVEADYLGSAFTITLLACPACGHALVPEDLALGKMAQVEALLEDK